MYMLKLNHLVDDKMHARSTGSYSQMCIRDRLLTSASTLVNLTRTYVVQLYCRTVLAVPFA